MPCVRWNSSGDMIASASMDATINLLDFKTEKVYYTKNTPDQSNCYDNQFSFLFCIGQLEPALSVCFI